MKDVVTYSLDIMTEKHILLMTYPLNHLYYIVNTLEAFYPIANKSLANSTIHSPLHSERGRG